METISNIANLLEISEFELFRMAYHAWYGSWPNDLEVEKHFGTFLTRPDAAPFYVQSYVRTPPFMLA